MNYEKESVRGSNYDLDLMVPKSTRQAASEWTSERLQDTYIPRKYLVVILVRFAGAKVVKSGQTEAPGIIVVVGGLSAGRSILQLVSTCVC